MPANTTVHLQVDGAAPKRLNREGCPCYTRESALFIAERKFTLFFRQPELLKFGEKQEL
jgi:hypothetical protein